MSIKMIISDLDGTLLNEKHTISQLTANTLEKVSDLGIQIVFATGRNFFDAKHIRDNINIKADIISSNGSSFHNDENKLIFQQNIHANIAKELFKFSYDKEFICLNSYQDDDWFIDRDIPDVTVFHPDSKYKYNIVNFSNHHIYDNLQKLCYLSLHPEKLQKLSNSLCNEFGDHIEITASGTDNLEVMSKNINKASTLKILLEKYKIDPKDCIAFGDNLNDFEMLSYVGNGVVMGNANPILKEKLPHNTHIDHHNKDAVANYLLDILKI